jgi:hypothetical protein
MNIVSFVIVILIFSLFSSESSSEVAYFSFFLTDKNKCLKANVKSHGEGIQAGPNCGWVEHKFSK